MQKLALIIGFLAVLVTALFSSAWAQLSSETIVLDVDGGDTAFALKPGTFEAWWLKGECRVAIPIDIKKSTASSLISEMQTDTVSLGARNIRLSQQFRFDLQSDTIDVSIYSSVRGGWAAVPTKRDRACEASACRARTELPEC